MRILIIEDDKEQSSILQFALKKEGITSDACYDGDHASYYLEQNAYDIVLLDRMLPRKNGVEILKEMRASGDQTPVIMVTALGELDDRISGLDSGADDYLVKPYEFKELMARIRCILRRPANIEDPNILTCADITYNPDEKVLTGPNGSFTLSNKEGDLLELFIHNPDRTLSRQLILARVWGADYEIEEGNLDNYIYFVRRRIKNAGSILVIKTMRGIGYMLVREQ